MVMSHSAHIQIVFGVAAYNDIMGPAAFKGKLLGFVGDRSSDSTVDVIFLS